MDLLQTLTKYEEWDLRITITIAVAVIGTLIFIFKLLSSSSPKTPGNIRADPVPDDGTDVDPASDHIEGGTAVMRAFSAPSFDQWAWLDAGPIPGLGAKSTQRLKSLKKDGVTMFSTPLSLFGLYVYYNNDEQFENELREYLGPRLAAHVNLIGENSVIAAFKRKKQQLFSEGGGIGSAPAPQPTGAAESPGGESAVFREFMNPAFDSWAWGVKDKSPLPSIGSGTSVAKLKRKGFATPLQLFGYFLFLENSEQFAEYVSQITNAHVASLMAKSKGIVDAFEIKRKQIFGV